MMRTASHSLMKTSLLPFCACILLAALSTTAAPSVLNEPQLLWGQADIRIRDLTFEHLTLGGKPVSSPDFFKTNEFVAGLIFAPAAASKP